MLGRDLLFCCRVAKSGHANIFLHDCMSKASNQRKTYASFKIQCMVSVDPEVSTAASLHRYDEIIHSDYF